MTGSQNHPVRLANRTHRFENDGVGASCSTLMTALHDAAAAGDTALDGNVVRHQSGPFCCLCRREGQRWTAADRVGATLHANQGSAPPSVTADYKLTDNSRARVGKSRQSWLTYNLTYNPIILPYYVTTRHTTQTKYYGRAIMAISKYKSYFNFQHNTPFTGNHFHSVPAMRI